ncbi:MAG: PAS domain-containing protein [Polyangia bacterium]
MNQHEPQPFLNALREPAALLTASGQIVARNPALSQLTAQDALGGEPFAPGSDFFEACARARKADRPSANITQGVRDVLSGKAESFRFEYDCGAADKAHTFELVASRYTAPGLDGALLVQYDVTERKRLREEDRSAQERSKYVFDLMPDGYWDWDIPSGKCYMSPRWCESLGYKQEELPPHIDTWVGLLHPDDVNRAFDALKSYWARGTGIYQCENRLRQKDGTYRWSLDQGRVISWSADGKPLRMVGVDININDRKLAELTIREQARRITELSTPLIPINDDVVVMPLIGSVEPSRAQQLLGSILEGLSRRGAQVAILDITGVSDMDQRVAAAVVKVARAVQLLGSRIVLTGVRPEVAKILVELDVDWSNLVIRSTLQSGIAYATGA